MAADRFDLLILGGGLAGGLCASALAQRQPELKVGIVEAGERIGGNHLWSFFESDIDPADKALVEPLVAHRWPGYSVYFPAHRRRLAQAYRTIESERLDEAVRQALPGPHIIQGKAASVSPDRISLDDGREIHASAVLDARGGKAEGLTLGWQKFVGQLLLVPQGHGLREPIVMDATVNQSDGYRFVYCLPFDESHVFVEDTYYTDGPELDRDLLAGRIADYAAAKGWRVEAVLREECGQLPVVTGGDFDRFWPASDPIARAGVRGGFFHPLTSYSLPDAVRFASWLARELPLNRLAAATRARARDHWRSTAYDRFLARMLFKAADPPERYRILQRFYRLPEPLIARFYSGQSSVADRIRILAGKPPVSIGRALQALREER